MKNTILLLCLALIFQSCSSDESSKPNNSNSKFHPPTWLLGMWQNELKVIGYKFTSDDILIIQAGSIELSLKSQIEAIKKANGTATVEENITDSSYQAKIILNGGQTVYKFDKVTSSKIKWKTDIIDTELIKNN